MKADGDDEHLLNIDNMRAAHEREIMRFPSFMIFLEGINVSTR